MDYYSAVKNKKIVNFAGKWIALERIDKLEKARVQALSPHVPGRGDCRTKCVLISQVLTPPKEADVK